MFSSPDKQDPDPNPMFQDMKYSCDSDWDDKIPIIHFHKPEPDSTSQQAGHSENTRDQTEQTKPSDKKEERTEGKSKAGISFIAEDYDLLNSYWHVFRFTDQCFILNGDVHWYTDYFF